MFWVGGVAILAGLAGGLLHAVNAAAGREILPSFWLMQLAAAVAYGTLALVLRGRTTAALRATVAVIAAAEGFGLLAAELSLLTPSVDWLFWLGFWLWAPGFVAVVTVLPQLLPDGRALSARWRPLGWLGPVAVLAAALSWALTPYTAGDFTATGVVVPVNPVAVGAMAAPTLQVVMAALVVTAALGAAASLVVRWRRSVGVERQQLKWVLLGLGTTLVLIVLALPASDDPAQVLAALAMCPLPTAIGVAVLRYGLWEVDVVASRTLTYLAAGVVVAVGFVLLRWLLGLVPGADDRVVPVFAAVAAGLLGVALYARLRRWVNEFVHGTSAEPADVLTRLGDRLAGATDGEAVAGDLLPRVVQGVLIALRADRALLRLSDGTEAAASAPTAAASTRSVTLPLRYNGADVGVFEVSRQGGFGSAEQALLDRLAGRAAVAAHTVLLERRLRRSREQTVLAREEERRLIRRDLHDGVGPSLAAVALQLEVARDLTSVDPQAATGLLDRLAPRVNALVADVRALVLELRPPTLDELGLAAAIRELADRLSTAQTVVTSDGSVPGVLPAAVEVAAYRIAGEAATNAVRHAGAGTVRMCLDRLPAALVVAVADDGTGLPPDLDTDTGVGLGSMRQRAEEVGGLLEIVSGPSGTTVTATLPVSPTSDSGAESRAAVTA